MEKRSPESFVPKVESPPFVKAESYPEGVSPFSKMKAGPKPYMAMSEASTVEWSLVRNADDAIKWHLKWTPWFSPQMITGLVKYGYEAHMAKQ